jgi:MFS family permease
VLAVVAADAVSTLGSEMSAVALPWFVLVSTGSPARMAGVLAAEYAGVALLGLPAGRAAQSMGARRAMLTADGVRAPLLVLIPVLHWLGALDYAMLIVAGAVVGGSFTAYSAAQRVLLAQATVDDELQLTRVGAVLGGFNETASFLGPAVGGALVALVGAPWVLVVDSASYVVSWALIAFVVRPVSLAVENPQPAEPAPAMMAGVRYLWSDAAIRRQLVTVMFASFAWTALMATLPVVARQRYHGGAQLAGALVASYGLGSVVGAVVASRTKRAAVGRPGLPLVPVAVATWVAVQALPAWGLALVVVVFGVANGLYFPRLFTALTLRPPVALRTQVLSAAQVVMTAGSPIGFVAAGLLLDRHPPGVTFMLTAVAMTVAVGVSVTGEPLRAGVDVERGAAQEADEGEAELVGERDGE